MRRIGRVFAIILVSRVRLAILLYLERFRSAQRRAEKCFLIDRRTQRHAFEEASLALAHHGVVNLARSQVEESMLLLSDHLLSGCLCRSIRRHDIG